MQIRCVASACWLLLAGSLVAAVGCAVSGGSGESTTYVLDAEPEVTTAERAGRGVMLIATPRAEAAYDTTGIAYSRQPLTLEYYSKSHWADLPSQMLAALLARTVERSGAFRAVVTQPTAVAADWELDINVVRMRQEFRQQPSQVTVAIRVDLIATASSRVIASRLFEASEPAPSENAYGGVQAANIAVGRLLAEIVEFVQRQTSKET